MGSKTQDAGKTALLGRIRDALRAAHGDRLVGVVLFGSEANGNSRSDSDIDVLVLLDEPVRYADDLLSSLVALRSLSAELGRRISPKPVGREYFETTDTPILLAARREGLRL